MPRYKLTIEYDGTHLAGWQKQREVLSIQEILEAAISAFCNHQHPVETVAAGRTDAGVHALGQVVHVDLAKEYTPYSVRQGILYHIDALWKSRYGMLPSAAISIVEVEQVEETFHARFSAKKRHYLYRMLNRPAPSILDAHRIWHIYTPLDITAMQNAAPLLLGHHDFTSFRSSICQSRSPIKTLDRLDISQQGEEIHFHVSATSFLHHQVRNLVGSLLLVGQGKWQADDIERALHAKDRNAAGPTAKACGLYFLKVDY